ncbi:hypothetical protein R1sor_022987 [Riccia sorocarpa]|uniref:BHLH domain-containing protein n=1 Tax=Riccia sorocarpa TaxID=122646 RepID=A0ABD3GMY3_9MARC
MSQWSGSGAGFKEPVKAPVEEKRRAWRGCSVRRASRQRRKDRDAEINDYLRSQFSVSIDRGIKKKTTVASVLIICHWLSLVASLERNAVERIRSQHYGGESKHRWHACWLSFGDVCLKTIV